ncbi:MAG: DUF3298 domain-containing protein [Actinomycetota bacterium]|nr:MAG: DUF3298 domain-containing protein [Actinomycetota bacterium]
MFGMKSRWLIIPAITLGLSVTGCESSHIAKAASAPGSALQPVGTKTGTSHRSAAATVSLKSYVTSARSPDLVVNISYPALEGMASRRVEEGVNSIIFNSVTRYVSDFETSLKGETGVIPPGTGGTADSQSEITGSFTKELLDSRYASFKFAITTYFAGAASPTTQARSLTFDLSNGKLLQLADLFSGSNYLPTLSSRSKAAVEAKLGQNADQSLIDFGTQPNAVNFANWNLTKKGLELTFSQGQVGAGAAGMVSIILPYSGFAQIANSPGPLTNP